MHGKLTEVDGRSRCRKESYRKVTRAHEKYNGIFVHCQCVDVNFPCVCRTFYQLSICSWDLLSTFRMFLGLSINFPSGRKTFCLLLSTFRASAGPPANFLYGRGTVHQLSVHPWDLPSTAVNILCPQNLPEIFHSSARSSVNFRQLSEHPRNLPSTFRASAELPSNSVSFSCVCGNFEKFRTAIGSSVNFSHLSVQSRDFPSAFCASAGHSVNFRQLSVHPRDCLLTFHASAGPSVNFCQLLCGCGTFRQLSVHPRDLPSTFFVSAEISVNFRQHYVVRWDLPSTSVSFPLLRVAFGQLSVLLRDFP